MTTFDDVTPSHALDLERCRDLCGSIDRLVTGRARRRVVASRLFGLEPEPLPALDHAGRLIAWRRDAARALAARIEEVAGIDRVTALPRARRLRGPDRPAVRGAARPGPRDACRRHGLDRPLLPGPAPAGARRDRAAPRDRRVAQVGRAGRLVVDHVPFRHRDVEPEIPHPGRKALQAVPDRGFRLNGSYAGLDATSARAVRRAASAGTGR